MKNRQKNRNRSTRIGHAVSAPSRYRTCLQQHFALPRTLFITHAECPEDPVAQNALSTQRSNRSTISKCALMNRYLHSLRP